MADDSACTIERTDPRLADQEVRYLVSNVKCKLRLPTVEKKRSSVYTTPEGEGKYVMFAAVAVTDKQLLLDVQRVGKDEAGKQYLCILYDNPLFSELGLQFDAQHLNIILPDAGRFLGEAGKLGVADDAEVGIMLTLQEAPDIAMFVNGVLRDLAGNNCIITEDDPRLEGHRVEFLLNSMKVKLLMDSPTRRSSVYATPEAASRHLVFAALAVTEQKIILDVTWAQKDPSPRNYLNLDYTSELFREVVVDFVNSDLTSELRIKLPHASRFINAAADLGVPDDATITMFIDTWKAPDIAMLVSRKSGRRASVGRSESKGTKTDQ